MISNRLPLGVRTWTLPDRICAVVDGERAVLSVSSSGKGFSFISFMQATALRRAFCKPDTVRLSVACDIFPYGDLACRRHPDYEDTYDTDFCCTGNRAGYASTGLRLDAGGCS